LLPEILRINLSNETRHDRLRQRHVGVDNAAQRFPGASLGVWRLLETIDQQCGRLHAQGRPCAFILDATEQSIRGGQRFSDPALAQRRELRGNRSLRSPMIARVGSACYLAIRPGAFHAYSFLRRVRGQ